jgi:hypothetical protein
MLNIRPLIPNTLQLKMFVAKMIDAPETLIV